MKLFAAHRDDAHEADGEALLHRRAAFAAAVVLFLVVTMPLEASLLPFHVALDVILESPSLREVLSSISGKFASSTREELVQLAVGSFVIPLKKVGFILSISVLLFLAFRSIKRAPWLWFGWRARLRKAAVLSLLIACLVLPLKLRSLGDLYARMSLSPFEEPFGLIYRRALMPALANTLGLSGYVLYLLFSIFFTVLLVYLVLAYFEKNGTRLSSVTVLSLLTSSFVMYGFEMPGYPDQLAMIFLLLMLLLPPSMHARLSLVALSLATHEASVLMMLPVIAFFFTREEQQSTMKLLGVYAFLVLAGTQFDVERLFTAHAFFDATGFSPWDYIVRNPTAALVGIAVAYKLFWIVIATAAVRALKGGEPTVARTIIACTLVPLVVIPFAVDTSRFAGFGFLGLLAAVRYVVDQKVLTGRTFDIVAIMNLLIPSVYVGLNSGVAMFPGLYSLLYCWWQ